MISIIKHVSSTFNDISSLYMLNSTKTNLNEKVRVFQILFETKWTFLG